MKTRCLPVRIESMSPINQLGGAPGAVGNYFPVDDGVPARGGCGEAVVVDRRAAVCGEDHDVEVPCAVHFQRGEIRDIGNRVRVVTSYYPGAFPAVDPGGGTGGWR